MCLCVQPKKKQAAPTADDSLAHATNQHGKAMAVRLQMRR
jgi:hypothetical protein